MKNPSALSAAELDKILDVAVKAADIGQKILTDYYGRISQISEKELAGLVSEADVASEKAITQYLRQEFPEHDVMGEEATFKNPDQRHAKPGRWVLDPLDGTTNYIHQFPIYCVSIGFEWMGETVVAVINVPVFKKVYTARRGGGCFLNGQPIRVSSRDTVEGSLFATGFTSYKAEILENQINVFRKIVSRARGVRRAGSAAYDLCLVAEGVFDAYWEYNIQPWDVSAGLLLVKEAGGVVTDYKGNDYRSSMRACVSGNPFVQPQLLKIIQDTVTPDILAASGVRDEFV